MRKYFFWGATLCLFVILNWLIIGKQRLVDHGESVLLELAPVDPRSLMQGDYMALNYEIIRTAFPNPETVAPVGKLVLRRDFVGVARFVRFDDGRPLAQHEIRLIYRCNEGRVRLGAESYFFQEGTASTYEKAKYGELKVAPDGGSVLIGLCDKDLRPLGKVASGL